jgi:hypothetical protein
MGYAYPIDSKVVTNPNGTIDYDRASSSTQLRGLIKSMITNGVNLTESTNLQVMADEETMNLLVKPGYVIIEGALKHFEDDVKVTIGAADTTNPRIDTVVARLNLNEDVRDIVIDVLQGTPSAEPTAPELTRTTSYYEVGLADILVEVGATQISQAVVTDTRLLNSRCGMISAIGEIDTETLFNQLTTDFDNWFESIKGKLGDDVAGGLQMQIDGLADDIDTLQEDVETLESDLTTLESGVASERLLWNISDKIYSKLTNLGITFPSSNIFDLIAVNNKIYVVYGAGSKLYIMSYNGETWGDDLKIVDTAYSNAQLAELNGQVYVLYHTTGANGSVVLYKYDDESNTVTLITSKSHPTSSSAEVFAKLCKDEKNNLLYVVWSGRYQSTAYSLVYFTYDGATMSSVMKSNSTYVQAILYGAIVIDGIIYGDMRTNSSAPYYFSRITCDTTNNAVYNSANEENWQPAYTKIINEKIYSCNNNILFARPNFDKCQCLFDVKNICAYQDGFISFGSYGVKKLNLYKIATSYATKGTKIYLTDNSFAMSDNLEPIDNGYLVTADGEVKIGIYE